MADTSFQPGSISRAFPRHVIAGRYEVERELGRGATAIVYLARDVRYDRKVAVKVLKSETAASVASQRFLREILITAQLQHPHLLPVLDSGDTNGQPFFVTPYLEGGTLRARLEREHQLPIDEAISITRDVAEALACAHEQGIIHRDIKPENILFSGAHACVADFGIAQALARASAERLTGHGLMIGTPAYMSPEQAANDRIIDARTDVYSLGCVLYEMIAGERPSKSGEQYGKNSKKLSNYRSDVPPHVEAAIAHALVPLADNRTASAADFAAELGAPLHLPPRRAPLVVRRRRLFWISAGAVPLLLVAMAIAAMPRLIARYDYLQARLALMTWDLDAAEGMLRKSLHADARYAPSLLWLAQVLAWREPDEPADWRDFASRAAAVAYRRGTADSLLAQALAALAADHSPNACRAYRALHELQPNESVPWLGIAHCQGFDRAVIRDARTPSGWAFRGSYRAAIAALDSAMAHTVDAPDFAYVDYSRLLITQAWRLRTGAEADAPTHRFAAYPSIRDDTLAFVPYPIEELASTTPAIDRSTLTVALRRNADLLATRLNDWVRRAPRSALAHQLLALAQESQTAPMSAALSNLAEARRLTSDPARQLDLEVTEIRLLAKDGQFTRARELADSLLVRVPSPDAATARQLVGAAAITGKVDRTARLLRTIARDDAARATPENRQVAAPLAEAVATYTAFASLGDCNDSLRRAPESLDELLARYVPADSRESYAAMLLADLYSLAVPCVGPSIVLRLGGRVPRLVRTQQALARGRFAAVRAQLDTVRQLRRADRPGDVALDHTFQEAWLLAAIGDTAAATRHLDLSLTALGTLGAKLLEQAPQAAALGRAMSLRARLALATRDTATARRWATAAAELWATASPELRDPAQALKERAALASFKAAP